MTNPKILVTGATGRSGSAVVTQLLAKGWPVRAAVRVRDARSDRLQSRGAEVVVADIFDSGQLTDAMRGVQRAYYCPPYHPFVIQSAVAFADAARETGLEQIVGLSQWLAGPNHPALMSRQHWLIDRMFAALPGIAHTVVNPGFFADSPYLDMMPFAAHLGVLPLPMAGESRNAPPSVDDIARVAVAALSDPARHAGKSYRPTGPQLLTVTEMAAIIGRVVGHNVRHVKSPLWMFYKGAKALGAQPFLLSGIRYWGEDNDRGAFAVGAPNDTVRELTGKEAEDFETIARRHAALPPSRQNFRTRLAVLARFMMLPMLPGFDPVAYERTQEHPAPPTPRPAIDDAGWMASHGAERLGMSSSTLLQALA
jgi:NAD(P)H dehydrogenase (quinone)